ncbi:MAG: hypothetical protein R2854_26930 [Caldilineaceae bacterium]
MTIYDETLVPATRCPIPWWMHTAWPSHWAQPGLRRTAILDQFGMHVYGRTPATTFAGPRAVEKKTGMHSAARHTISRSGTG